MKNIQGFAWYAFLMATYRIVGKPFGTPKQPKDKVSEGSDGSLRSNRRTAPCIKAGLAIRLNTAPSIPFIPTPFWSIETLNRSRQGFSAM